MAISPALILRWLHFTNKALIQPAKHCAQAPRESTTPDAHQPVTEQLAPLGVSARSHTLSLSHLRFGL